MTAIVGGVAQQIATGAVVKSKFWADDDVVILERAVRADMADAPLPTFGQDRWDCSPVVHRLNASVKDKIIYFHYFNDPVNLLTAKEFAFWRMRQSARGPRKVSIGTVNKEIKRIHDLVVFMASMDVMSLGGITQNDCDAWCRSLQDKGLDKTTIWSHLAVLRQLYSARDSITYGSVSFSPWGTKSLGKVIGINWTKGENKTPRIHEDVIGPLLQWSLVYVDRFSADIIAADREWRKRRVTRAAGFGPGRRRKSADISHEFDEYIADLKLSGRPIPGKDGVIDLFRIQTITGIHRLSLEHRIDDLNVAAAMLGIGEETMDAAPSVLPETGQRWRESFEDYEWVEQEVRALISACYVICAYLSGMRDSEVQDMRRGCHRCMRDAVGTPIRHKIISRAYKENVRKYGEVGIERQWVVLDEVRRAVEVLEELLEPVHERTGKDALFMSPYDSKTGGTVLAKSVNGYINRFIEKIQGDLGPRLGEKLGIPPMPSHDGQPTTVTTRMFRRTVAWHIARQPFGVIAGMIQYGHASEIMFEGYAGTSASGFRSEVEAERAMARKSDIVEMYEDYKRGIKPSGPIAKTLVAEFQNVREALGDFPGVIDIDPRRREKMLDHLRTQLHPGLLADCFFRPADAKCLDHLKPDERIEPVLGICDPDCPNACWLKKHLQMWEGHRKDTERLSKRNRISIIQRDVLKGALAKCDRVIASIKGASNGS